MVTITHESILSIAQWHQQTFPDAELVDQITKFDEEYNEYRHDPSFEELADMFIVACGIARYDTTTAMGYFFIVSSELENRKEIAASVLFGLAIDKKMAKNRERTWEKTPQGNYHHTNTEL